MWPGWSASQNPCKMFSTEVCSRWVSRVGRWTRIFNIGRAAWSNSRFFPHIFVWSSFFCFSIPPPPPPRPPPRIFHTQLCHTPSFTHHFVIFHTQLCHTPSFTHHFVTHHLSHTTLSPTISHTELCHTPSFTHLLCHTQSFTIFHHLSHTTLSHTHTIFLVALVDIYLRFTWQAWRLVTSTFVLRGRRGTWWHPPSFCVAGVALGNIHLRFAWPVWHLVTSTFVSRGRRGTWGTGLALVARFAWQAWHLATSTCVLRGRRGTWWHAWQAWHLRHCHICLSFLPWPRYNICCSFLKEVGLWGYPVL